MTNKNPDGGRSLAPRANRTVDEPNDNALRDPIALGPLWRRQWKYALVVAVLGPLGYVLVLYAMREAPMSHVAPAREVSMLFAALIGGHLLGEGDRAARICGALCIAAGVTALALG